MDKPSPSFDGLLTDYALGEIDDPEVAALIEALLERDEALRATLADIRSTTDLVVLAGAQSLAPDPRPQALWHRWPVWAAAAAVVLLALAWLRPPAAESDPPVVERAIPAPAGSGSIAETPAPVAAESRLRWMVAAVEKRSRRTNRRGAGIDWAAMAGTLSTSR